MGNIFQGMELVQRGSVTNSNRANLIFFGYRIRFGSCILFDNGTILIFMIEHTALGYILWFDNRMWYTNSQNKIKNNSCKLVPLDNDLLY